MDKKNTVGQPITVERLLRLIKAQRQVDYQAEQDVRRILDGRTMRVTETEFCTGLTWIAVRKAVEPNAHPLPISERTVCKMRTTVNRRAAPGAARTIRALCEYVGAELPRRFVEG